MKNLEREILEKAKSWLSTSFDEKTRNQVQHLLDYEPEELTESFYKNLEFGTGGLRGIMGVGTNRMNKYTVGMATQGLANYLIKTYPKDELIKVVIGYDSRNNSLYFAEIAADVLSANGCKVYLFEDLRPTPEISFAIRHLNCHSGIIITASHNPKEYNGYKAYWNDGAQLIPPHDKNVVEEASKIFDIAQVKFKGKKERIEILGEEIDNAYLKEIKGLSLSPEAIKAHHDIKIVYTPLHGTGAIMVPRCLKEFGFTNISSVEEQSVPDGNFPTVKSPNPEESAALKMAIDKAIKIDASLVMATDPDADRVGIAVRNHQGEFVLVNGNQTACLLTYYLLKKWEENKKLTGKEYIVKTIVTSELMKDIAIKFNVEYFDVLTGFKWIADVIRKNEEIKTFIGGGEESYGYMIGDFIRDKDAVSACAMIAEIAAWAAKKSKTIYDILIDIAVEFGLYKESLISIVRKGKTGAEEIQQMMANFRNYPPEKINGSRVILIKDYELQKEFDLSGNSMKQIDLPKSNVLQFFTEDGSKISVRPSGTEPKIKFYFSVMEQLYSADEYDELDQELGLKINNIIADLKLI
ncbi:MAG: phosphoglucomutase [Bacteroidetes bacterium HGW-Bacteroidetes-17]|nr:MAG: phosphoglucomutase [Bacteroidetes bacterium HGW-Bacteroidetes-17]